MLDWDDLRLFLAVARAGSFVGGGRSLGLNHTTLARRLSALEATLGTRLFERSPRGLLLTRAGTELRDHAERVENEVLSAGRSLAGREQQLSGTVRLATPEAFGTFFVAPRARALAERHPGIEIELVPETRAINLLKSEADIAVGLHRPARGTMRAARLVDYRLGLYAAESLIAQTGPIASLVALRDQPFVGYIEERLDLPELRNLGRMLAPRSVFRSSSVAAQMAAVAGGLGFGLLHCFAVTPAMRVVRVLPDEVAVQRSYWMSYHADLARVPRIRAVADFLVQQVRMHAADFG